MIVDKIRKLCADNRISLAALEREVGLGNGVIARWGEMNPRVDRLKAVADFFGCTVDELLEES